MGTPRTAPPVDDAIALAEQHVLAALMVGDAGPGDLVGIAPQDLQDPRHVLIMRAALECHSRHGRADPLAVADVLGQRLADAGGYDHVLSLAFDTPPRGSPAGAVRVIADAAARRKIAAAAAQIAEDAAGGADVTGLRAHLLAAAGPDPAPRRAPRSWAAVASDPAVSWLVDGLLPRGGLGVLAGGPGAGKTLLALDLVMRMWAGSERWAGVAIRPGSTLYLGGEAHLGARLRAWATHHHVGIGADTGRHVDILDAIPDLASASGHAELLGVLAQCAVAPDLVVIDTLHAAAPNRTENDSDALGPLLKALADVRHRHGCAVLLVHHTRKRGGKDLGSPATLDDLRGSGALAGAVDVALVAERRGDARELRAVKIRDGAEPSPWRYDVLAVPTGRTLADGAAEYGPVIVPAADEARAQTDPAASLDEDVAAVIEAVRREGGSVSPIDALGPLAGISRDRGRVAVRLAVSRGDLQETGSTRSRKITLPTARAVSPIPPVPRPRESRSGGPRTDSRGPRESARIRAKARIDDSASPDDGLPERPSGRRRAKAVAP